MAGADVVSKTEGETEGSSGRTRRSRRGLRTEHAHEGCPGTWEASRPPPGRGVPEAEGNRRPRDGPGGVGAIHSTEEAREPTRRDLVEGRESRITELWEGKMGGRSGPETISTKQAQIARLAKQMPDRVLTTLAHHMDLEWLCEAHRRTRQDGAPGVDGQSGAAYSENLEGNLRSLLERAKSGTYRAPAVRRVHIPKDGSKTRPIGIPTYEDKVLQRGVMMLVEPVYEEDFYNFSYGFRPGRSAHDALEALNKVLFRMKGGWVLDVDIQSFFDTLDHEKLRELLSRRVADGVVVRLIGKWLRAGVLEGGKLARAEKGTPQGGVISPLLANIYLHEVLDKWWIEVVLPRLRGEAYLIRYADDFVMVFSEREDAERVLGVLPQRFARFGLGLHPEKTRLVPFRPSGPKGQEGKPESFDFLGLTHYWARARRGQWAIKRKTAKRPFTRALCAINRWMCRHRHLPIKQQAEALGRMLCGHMNYYGLRGNSRSINRFHYEVRRLWRKWLSRRSQRGRLTWEAFNRLLTHYPLPPARLRPGWGQLRLANL